MREVIKPLPDDPINECLDCHHEGQEWAEDTGEECADVYCPRCGSIHYYIKDMEYATN